MATNMQQSRPALGDLLLEELKLARSQWEERAVGGPAKPRDGLENQYLEIDCLVHDDWLSGAVKGHLAQVQVPQVSQEEVHWLLQPSCDSVLPCPWQRVHLCCFRKADPGPHAQRMLVPQADGYSRKSVHEFLTQVAQENLLQSWRETMLMVHKQPTKLPTQREVTSAFVHQLVEQLYKTKIQQLCTGTPANVSDSQNSENANQNSNKSHSHTKRMRLNSFSENTTTSRSQQAPEDTVHSNLAHLLAAAESKNAFYLVFPYQRFTLFDATVHSPAMFGDSVAKPLFVLYQLLQLLDHCHSKGITLGELGLKSIFVDTRLWVKVRPPPSVFCSREIVNNDRSKALAVGGEESGGLGLPAEPHSNGQSSSLITGPSSVLTLSSPSKISGSHPSSSTKAGDTSSALLLPDLSLSEATQKWRIGCLSNFDYLMILNLHAGRSAGDPNNHPIFPWVMDFTHPDGGYRDLAKSKHRLNKGDEQLDFTYLAAQEELKRAAPDQDTLVPHHISDISSDVTYYVYLARKTPKEVLCSRVRPRWVPEEYPASLEKMYIWTPDECIPEFFTDASLFRSIHPDLPDLALPSWCQSPEEMIALHRRVLEGDHVSSQLHHWIDLVFGYKLSGSDAVKAKNVYLSLVDKHKNPTNCGIVQLFKSSHPKRIQKSSTPYALFEWESYLNMSSLMNVTGFSIEQIRHPQQSSAQERYQSPPPNSPKTLESILYQQTLKSSPRSDTDGPQGETGGENQDDDLEDSYEHVTLPPAAEDVKLRKGRAEKIEPSAAEIGINYGEAPTVSVANEKAVKGKGERQFRVPVVRPVVDYFRQRRSVNLSLDVESGYDWQQSAGISLPKEAYILDPLIRLEELAGFVAKSCKDDGGLFQEQWDPEHLFKLNESKPPTIIDVLTRQEENPAYYPSFEDRVGIDIVAVTCTVIEMCCWRQLRAAMPANPSLLQRVSTIRRLLKNGQLQIKSFLSTLADFVLHPETATSLSPEDIHLPSLSSSLLLQTYLPIVAFPSYFETLFKFVSKLEQVCHECSLNFDCANLQRWVVQVLGYTSSSDAESITKVIDLVSQNLTSLLDIVNSEGFFLLLLHVYPFFQYPDTMFEAVYSFLDPLSRRLSRKNAERLFSCVLIQLFDSATEPHQRAQLLSRTTADLILKRFSLKTFLERFLGFYIDAVIEPARVLSKVSATKRHGSNIVRLQSRSSTLMASDALHSQAFEDVSRERERERKTDFSFSLALSETIGLADYDSDKDYSTDDSDNYDDDDQGYSADMSLLVKTDMGHHASSALPSISEVTDVASSSSLPLMSLMLGSQQENLAAGTGDGSLATKSWREQGEGGAGEENRNVMEGGGFTELSMAAADGTASNVQAFESTTSTSSAAPQSQSHSQSQFQSHHTSATSPESPVRKGYSFSFNSVFSEDPNDPQVVVTDLATTNIHPSTSSTSIPAVPTEEQLSAIRAPTLSVSGNNKHIPSPQPEEPFAAIDNDDDEIDDEEVENADAASTSSMDPQTMAVTSYLSEVSADCVSWLMRRLGPFLATQHIAKPLVESLHRCFLGVVNSKGRETSAVQCLSSYAEYYGETVVLRFYIPHAESLVNSAITRMSMKSEAGVAASLALVKLSIKALSPKTLEDGVANDIADHYFLPLIQLLSAQTTFPSGGKARAAICQTMVSLLVQLGEKLETRELASEVLMPTVKGFFACFSVVHETGSKMHAPTGQSPIKSTGDGLKQNGGVDRDEIVSVTPTIDDPLGTRNGPHRDRSPKELNLTNRGVPAAEMVEQHPLTPQKEDLDMTPKLARHSRELKEEILFGESETYRQVCATFSRPMAHNSYIQFCRLLGQYNLGDKLYNRELIEQIAYGHDEAAQPKSPLPNVLAELEPESDPSSESEDDSDGGESSIEKRDAAIKVGPIIAVTGLGKDASGFGRSSWFVALDEREESAKETVAKEEESSITKTPSTKGPLHQLLSGRSSSDGQPNKSNSLGRDVASFDAKFAAVPSMQPDVGVGVAGGRGQASSGSVSGSGVLSSGGSSGHGSSSDEADHTLTGSWELLWETRLQKTVYARDSFSHFKGERLQTFAGHKGAIKCLASADGEHYFVSGSKDRTAKVWSVRNHGTSSGSVGCRLTYSGHQKSVFAVELMENLDSVASCDGSVHHWDTETGYCIHQYTSPRNTQYVAMTALPSPQPVVAVATSDLHLRFIDLRMKSYQQLWRLQYPTAGATRVLTCAENWIAAGSNSGTVNSLDLRNGEFLCMWRPSEFPSAQQTWNESLHQIQSTPRGNLVTSAGNGLLGLWKPAYGRLLHLLKGQSSVTQCLEVVGEQLISVSNGGCVVVHDSFENSLKSANPSSVRLRYLRGVSSLTSLPENHLLLLGSDNGNIALMA